MSPFLDFDSPHGDSASADARRLAEVFRSISFLPGEAYGPHSHRRIEINYVSSGSCFLLTEGKRLTFRKGDTMLIAPGTPHRFQAGRKGAALLQLEMMPEVLALASGKASFSLELSEPVVRISGNARIRSTIHAIIWELANKKTSYRNAALLNYAQLIILLRRHCETASADKSYPSSLTRAKDIIDRNALGRISLSEVAAGIGISDRELRRLFAVHLQISPSDYVARIRIQQAIAMLTSGEHSVKEVCFACGFSSPQYFSRAFKKVTGRTPMEFLVR